MLKIEMDDVIGVLQSCKVQIGVIVGVLALLVIALIACRKMDPFVGKLSYLRVILSLIHI